MSKDSKNTKTELSEYPELLQKLLKNRNIKTKKDAETFLNPKYEDFSDPFLLENMQVAIDRILQSILKKERMTIYADYDADGVPGAVILSDFFKQIGYENFSVYIPHRHNEGYGFHASVVEKLVKEETKLIITIDLGVTAIDTVALAKKLKVDVIITDHHEPKETLPDAFTIVNPKLGNYPDRMLCGAATIFQVVRGVIHTLRNNRDTLDKVLLPYSDVVASWPEGHHKWWLDLVGLATIADMVPLLGENRILAHYGLLVARKSRRPGLHALASEARFDIKGLDEQDIGFTIAPRINSASRLEHAEEAFNLLSAPDYLSALSQAKVLSRLNDKRKRITATTVKQASKIISARTLQDVLVVGHPDWNPGVLSILAGKLMEKHDKTSFIWTTHGTDMIKGSVRAKKGESVLRLMEGAAELFTKFGGHEAAGGFTCSRDNIHFLEEKLQAVFEKEYGGKVKEKFSDYEPEAEILIEKIDRDFYKMIRQLSPFGMGNPEPIFSFVGGMVEEVRLFGKNSEHLEIILKDSKGKKIKAVAFYKTLENYNYVPKKDEFVQIVGNLTLNKFLGKEELRISLLDILPS